MGREVDVLGAHSVNASTESGVVDFGVAVAVDVVCAEVGSNTVSDFPGALGDG